MMSSEERDRKRYHSSKEKRDKKEKKYKKEKRDKRSNHSDSDSSDSEYVSKKKAKKLLKSVGDVELPSNIFGYDNENNPFGDENLTKAFVWKKKIEKMVDEGKDVPTFTADTLRKKLEDNRQEVLKVKERRELRERERQEYTLLKDQIQRDLEMESNLDWEKKEGEFHRLQAWKRSELRIQEHREKPIDNFLKCLFLRMKLVDYQCLHDLGVALGESDREQMAHSLFLASLDVDVPDLVGVYRDLGVFDLTALAAEIEEMIHLGGSDDDIDFWECQLVLCKRALDIAKIMHTLSMNYDDALVHVVTTACLNVDNGDVVHHSNHVDSSSSAGVMTGSGIKRDVVGDVLSMLNNKAYSQLLALQTQVQSKISAFESQLRSSLVHDINAAIEGVNASNVDYWKAINHELKYALAAAKVRAFQRRLLKIRLEQLLLDKAEEELAAMKKLGSWEASAAHADAVDVHASLIASTDGSAPVLAEEPLPVKREMVDERLLPPPPPPVLIKRTDVPQEYRDHICTVQESLAHLRVLRDVVLSQHVDEAVERLREMKRGLNTTEEAEGQEPVDEGGDMYKKELNTALDADEELLDSAELSLATYQYNWQDKYRPRKPRYVNKVRTGFDWSKYNRTHYDKDNPPPKVVQGYKFHLFYPDLIDPVTPPSFKVQPDPDGNPDYCILRFMAGAPYEDVAFKIVNKKWNTHVQRGYRCVFQKGVLTLWFNFQRVGYRR